MGVGFGVDRLMGACPVAFFTIVTLFATSTIATTGKILLPLTVNRTTLSIILTISTVLGVRGRFHVVGGTIVSLGTSLSSGSVLGCFPLPTMVYGAGKGVV